MQRIERLQLLFNAILALCAVIALGLGGWQLCAMRGQLDLMQLDQRPWLKLDATLVKEPEDQRGVRFEITNVGNTPGTVIEQGGVIIYCEPGQAKPELGRITITDNLVTLELDQAVFDDVLKNTDRTQTVIAPAEANTDSFNPGRSLGKEGASQLVVLGLIVYLDTAGERHTTWACFWYEYGKLSRFPRYNKMD